MVSLDNGCHELSVQITFVTMQDTDFSGKCMLSRDDSNHRVMKIKVLVSLGCN